MAERWSFGEPALAETERFAAVARRIDSLVLQLERPSAALARLLHVLEEAERELATEAPPDPRPRVGPDVDGDGRVYLDHARHVGGYNPAFPTYQLAVDGDRAQGSATFPIAYEGPPGVVHGGFVALLFDLVIQHHNCELGTAGRTTALDVRYLAPTPLVTELDIEVSRTAVGRRIESEARLLHGGELCATATMRAAAAERAALPPVSRRRS